MKIEPGQKVLVVGDSITDMGRTDQPPPAQADHLGSGFVRYADALLKITYPHHPVTFVNRGVSGDTVRELAARWDRDVRALEPDWLAVMIGINDVWRNFERYPGYRPVSVEEYRSILDRLLGEIDWDPAGLVLMTPFLVEPDRSDPLRALADRFGRAVREIAENRRALFVDTQAQFDKMLEHHTGRTLAPDRVHPGLEGHLLLARSLLQVFEFDWEFIETAALETRLSERPVLPADAAAGPKPSDLPPVGDTFIEEPVETPAAEDREKGHLGGRTTWIEPVRGKAGHPAQQEQNIDTAIHQAVGPAQRKLARRVRDWQKARDKRVVFAHTYLLMTNHMHQALDDGEYRDSKWVRGLLEQFAQYYFDALEKYEMAWYAAPPIWRIAFQVAENPNTMTAQHLLLGINAHINNDLVLTLIDMLDDEWPGLTDAQKRARYEDHTYVNRVIARTMDETQEEIINRYSPVLDALNRVSFNMDYVMISSLINHWREQVWQHAAAYLDLDDRDERDRYLQKVEYIALRRADVILLKQGPFKMKRLM